MSGPKRAPEAPRQKKPEEQENKLSGIGATEDQVNAHATVPQRIDKVGSKVEDIAGTGEVDAEGG